MEFDEIVVKESPGLCRCCLSEGCYKDLGTEYSWMNETEVYADMLLECFDISITQQNEGPNGPNRLICEVCITRLRDACNFKKQVMDSERKFIDMIGRGEFRPKMLIYQTQMKCEDIAAEAPVEDGDVEYLEEDIEFADDDLIKDESAEPSVSDITVSTLPVKGKRGRPRKNAPLKTEKRAKVEEKAKTSKAVAKDARTKNGVASIHVDTKTRTRQLLVDLLETSTAMPFKRTGSHYRCFYCLNSFYLASDLRSHTRKYHTNEDTQEIVKTIAADSFLKFDISDLQCRLCQDAFESIHDLVQHLRKHKKILDSDLSRILSFNLSDDVQKCLICDEEFPYFGPLLQHTHLAHLNRKYICETCGVSFVCKTSFLRHTESAHKTNNFDCDKCDKKFTSEYCRALHVKRMHNLENRKCHVCCRVLGSTYKKYTHLAKVHGIWETEFKCDICSKSFKFKSLLSKHIKRAHLKEKNVTCDVCGMTFFDTRALDLHKVSHTGERPFECEVCSKKFPRKKGLDIHYRIHTDDRRCVCKVCGKAFVQWASLKFHMKSHDKNKTS